IRRLQNLLTHSKVVQQKYVYYFGAFCLCLTFWWLMKDSEEEEIDGSSERRKGSVEIQGRLADRGAQDYVARQRQKLIQLISTGEKETEEGLRPSEASSALLRPPTASGEADHSVAKESDLPEVGEALGKTVVVGLRDRILVLQNQLAVKELNCWCIDCAPDPSPGLCPLSGVVDGKTGKEEEEEEEEEEKAAAVRLVRPAFRASLEEQPLPSSPGREKAEEDKVGWSLFKFSPLVFTSDSATASHDQQQASHSKPEHPGAESDDSDEIITIMSSFP
ncbi:hypothetical protein E2320_012228, partial [Naja naja]